MRIGITGHCDLTDDTVTAVAEELRAALVAVPDLVGVTCLARGADQLFARAVLDLGGAVEVVLPAADYRERKVKVDAAEFDDLIGKAKLVRTMPFAESAPDAYVAASEYVLDNVEAMIAVWDGGPSRYGGTGDVVAAARARGLGVTVVWPDGARRG
ncbi:hypothetical protein [Actinokineospora sp. HUAS TT18]|uniref:hypothetical protein n=1 Tax=Actinokineospora sp. HUAS TT18 TaxID=3447451 RepID=UPI003F51DEFA